jgi:hypothetical protein
VFLESINEAVSYLQERVPREKWPTHFYYCQDLSNTLELGTLVRARERTATLGATLAPLPGTELPRPCDCLIRCVLPRTNTPLIATTEVTAGPEEGFREIRGYLLGKWVRLGRYGEWRLF